MTWMRFFYMRIRSPFWKPPSPHASLEEKKRLILWYWDYLRRGIVSFEKEIDAQKSNFLSIKFSWMSLVVNLWFCEEFFNISEILSMNFFTWNILISFFRVIYFVIPVILIILLVVESHEKSVIDQSILKISSKSVSFV